YDKFILEYPDHELTAEAYIDKGKCRILKEISGADPNVGPGLTALEEFVKARRDQPNFADHKPDIRSWAKKITLEAAKKAERTRKQDPLDVSQKAQALLARFSPEGGFSKDLLDRIREQQKAAARAILKEEFSTGTVEDIKKLIADKKPLDALRARRALIERYEVLRDDRELKGLLGDIRKTEQSLVTVDKTGRNAIEQDRPRPVKALVLAPHTTSDSTLRADGTLVFTDAGGTVYGIESVTGEPRWSRVVGLNPPFAPMKVEASEPALLAFDTNHNELILIKQADGALLWRLPFESEAVKKPLVHESQIYLPTTNKNLYVIGLGSGRQSAKATFSQDVVGPPALSPDKQHLVVPGEEEIVYTLKLRPLQCVDVAMLGQKAGTIRVPMMKMGNLIMMVENNEAEFSRLRVMRGKPDGTELEIVAEARVEGQVLDPPVLRGRELFVASSPQRVTVFTINDQPGEDPIARAASNQLQDVKPTRMFLSAQPGGQLFLAGASLRKFAVQADTLEIDQRVTAEGIHVREPVSLGRRFYLTRREENAESTYFTIADGDAMTSLWRLIVGTKLVAVAPQESGDIVAVSDVGTTFRVKPDELSSGGFAIKASSQDVRAKNLTSRTQATRLHDNRIAVYWGEPTPGIVILNDRGQPLSQPLRLPAAPETTPVALGENVIVPVPGGLQVVNPKRGARKVTDYRAPQIPGEVTRWKSLTRLDDTQVAAVDSKNRMIKVQLRQPTGGRGNLAEVRILELESAIDQPPTAFGKYVLTANAAGQLAVLDATSLEYLATTQLPQAASSPAFGAKDRIFVDAGGRETLVYSLGTTLNQTGRIVTGGVPIAGAPMEMGNGFLVALQNGDLVMTDGQGNEAGQRVRLGQQLQSGPMQAGNTVFVVGVDGSLIRVDSLLQAGG
ncbi:MAG: PQQ-binding-like beta-propeller repeat protein, partial [Planctomycetaceae bacterium]